MDENTKKKLKERLTPEQYKVLVEKGTEAPFTGDLLHNKEEGSYRCISCGEELFTSKTKYDSGSGWPSFYDVVAAGKVELLEDTTLGTARTEVVCITCGAHLGHVFDDGPTPTGKRYCINSCALDFRKV